MSNVNAAHMGTRMARRWVRCQALTCAALALSLLLLAGQTQSASALFGGLSVLAPSVVFAIILAPRFGGASRDFLRAAVLAEAAKWVLTGAICAAVFIWVQPLAAGWFFAGMGSVLLAGWVGLAMPDQTGA